MSSLQTLEDMTFGAADDSDSLLVDPNMIPTVATEVVMDGDGIERFEEFSENPVNHDEEDPYQYEYAYDEDPDHHLQDIGEEEVVVAEEEFPDDWKDQQHKKLNLYEVLDGKMYHTHQKPAKRTRHDEFYQPAVGPGGPDYNYSADDGVQEYREYAVYSSSNNTPKSNNNNAADRNCPGCGMTLRRSVYYHHARMIREKGACNLFTPQRFPCTQCDARIGTLEKLCQHMEQIHHAPTQIKTAVFTNEEDFKTFRIDLEGKGGNFRMARGNKKNKKGVVQYFRCNRLQTLAKSQTFRPVDNPSLDELPSNRKRGRLHAQEIRTNSAKQVIRTENSCTAFYNKAYLENGTIEVRYCEHHLHDDEKLRLPDAVRKRVIELARKNLPHVVILMIVKDERFTYCDRNSANDRRIQDMKTQDIRQVLAGNNRAEKTRVQRGEPPREIIIEKPPLLNELLLASDDDPSRPWSENRNAIKIDRHLLTEQECRYLDLFDHNREEIMARLNEKARAEMDKKILFDSFIHRLSSSQEVFKHIHFNALPPNDGTLLKLKKACLYLTKIEELLLNPRRETQQINRFSSYIRMMEEEFRNHERPDGNGGAGIEEIDVVGIDEDDYNTSDLHHHHHHLHNVVGEEEVVGDGDAEAYHQNSEELEELQEVEEEYIGDEVIEEVEIQLEETEEVDMGNVHHQEEEVEQEEEHQQEITADGEDDDSAEPTVTRAGRIVKKKPLFDS